MKGDLFALDIIDFSESEIGLFDPVTNPIASTNGDSFMCCFAVHIHVESR